MAVKPSRTIGWLIQNRTRISSSGCWIWTGAKNPNGYGLVRYQRTGWLAHRLFYTLLVGPILEETIDHLCRKRACVNPAHLEPVAHVENMRRGTETRPCCKNGHPVVIGPDRPERCLACKTEYQRQYYRAHRGD